MLIENFPESCFAITGVSVLIPDWRSHVWMKPFKSTKSTFIVAAVTYRHSTKSSKTAFLPANFSKYNFIDYLTTSWPTK